MTQAWRPILEAMSLRNGGVEVTGMGAAAEGVVPPSYRVRLLAFNDNGLIIERPSQAEAGKHLAQGARARILLVQGDQRWELWTTVTHYSAFTLNGNARVMAVHLTQPNDVRTGQRRSFFRASTVGARMEPVVLTPMPAAEVEAGATAGLSDQATAQQQAMAVGPQSFKGKLINLGGGGIGVEAPQRAAAVVKAISRFQCRITLAAGEEPVEVIARIVHLQPLEGGTHYLGMCFEFADRMQKQRVTGRIQKFTAGLERQQLQRTGRRVNE